MSAVAVWACSSGACEWIGPFTDTIKHTDHWTCPECGSRAKYADFVAKSASHARKIREEDGTSTTMEGNQLNEGSEI